jgi:hypothetical protein
MTPPRNPPVYYNNSSYSQPSMMTRDGPLTNSVSGGATSNNSNAYLTDLHSHSVQSKYAHVRGSIKSVNKHSNFVFFYRQIICWVHRV